MSTFREKMLRLARLASDESIDDARFVLEAERIIDRLEDPAVGQIFSEGLPLSSSAGTLCVYAKCDGESYWRRLQTILIHTPGQNKTGLLRFALKTGNPHEIDFHPSVRVIHP